MRALQSIKERVKYRSPEAKAVTLIRLQPQKE